MSKTAHTPGPVAQYDTEFALGYSKPFIGLLNGLPVRDPRGKVRRFKTQHGALRATFRAAFASGYTGLALAKAEGRS